jgi:hypothetical protein
MIFLSWVDASGESRFVMSVGMRRLCTRHLAEFERRFGVPCPFDRAELARRVSQWLGYPIMLVPIRMPSGAPSGITLFTDTGRVIAYTQDTSAVHQDHIVAHEIGHIILGHVGVELDDANDAARTIFPHLGPALVHEALTRVGSYDPPEENAAETMATLLLEAGNRPRPHADVPPDPRYTDVAIRLSDTLEGIQ